MTEAVYRYRMNTKNLIIGVVIIVIILIGGYFVYKNTSSAPAAAENTQTAATSTDQVQAQEVSIGTGKTATPGTVVSVLYVGKLQDGTVFDSSEAHGNQPLTFTLGSQGLIPGFQIGINTMKEGGERLLAIPPALGYGAQDVKDASGKVIIPANSTLIFDVKLVKVAAATTTTTGQ